MQDNNSDESKYKKILLCDDNVLNRKLVVAMLTGSPYRVREVASGQEALVCLFEERQLFDLILLDINMIGMSGVEVCRAIRNSEQDKLCSVPVLAYTAHALETERDSYVSCGFNDILAKPILRDDLFNALRTHLK
ncbi:MAG: response regulator [Desulfuromonadaceae bacterium]